MWTTGPTGDWRRSRRPGPLEDWSRWKPRSVPQSRPSASRSARQPPHAFVIEDALSPHVSGSSRRSHATPSAPSRSSESGSRGGRPWAAMLPRLPAPQHGTPHRLLYSLGRVGLIVTLAAALWFASTATGGLQVFGKTLAAWNPIGQHAQPDSWMWGVQVPRDRLLVYYHIPYAPWGYLGAYTDTPHGDDQLLARIAAQSQAYAKLDPRHPVVSALDIVSPVAQADPQPDGSYTAFTPDSVVEHYYQLATRHHMLFFLDVQPGRMPLDTIVTRLWKWLQLPNVHLALDAEFDVAPDGVPDQDLGVMHASEINEVVARLANLVASKHLPHKIVILHQWSAPSLPDWHDVRTNQDVAIVTCADGFGTPGMKLDKYDVFDHQRLIQYAGIKLFYPNWPGQREDHPLLDHPLMAPADVLKLQPPPTLVMYQ